MAPLADFAWAAGFIEGEGSFYAPRRMRTVTVTQVQREPLERLQRVFGGVIGVFSARNPSTSVWRAHGATAVGVIATIWPWLSPRRRAQVGDTVAKWSKGWWRPARVRATCRHHRRLRYVCRECL